MSLLTEECEDAIQQHHTLGVQLGVFLNSVPERIASLAKDALGQICHRVQFLVFNDVMRWSYGRLSDSPSFFSFHLACF